MIVYYPKNKVKTNLKTTGGEFTTPEGNDYVGDYYELWNGQCKAGKSPATNKDIKLTKVKNNTLNMSNVSTNDGIYLDQISSNRNIQIINNSSKPPSFTPKPTPADYQKGAITRYFCRKTKSSSIEIIEISKDTYDDLQLRKGNYNYVLYSSFKLFWKISGPLFDDNTLKNVPIAGIISTNSKILANKAKIYPGIDIYLNNITQFSQPQKIDVLVNQYADKGVFKFKKNNEDFVGYYHVMGDGTIMAGSNHASSKKEILIATNDLIRQKLLEKVNKTISELSLDPKEKVRIFDTNSKAKIQPTTRTAPSTRSSLGGGGGGY